MQVTYFSNQFASSKGHGIARYAHELYKALQELPDAPKVVPVAAWSDREEQDLSELKKQTDLEILPWGQKVTPLMWNFLDWPKIERWLKHPSGLVHAVSLGYRVATHLPYIVTVHDIGPLTHPAYFQGSPSWIMRRSLEQAVKQAVSLVCVSQATADELQAYVMEHYGVDVSERITVVHEGVGEEFFEDVGSESLEGLENLPPVEVPIILSAGKISPRKNVQGIIEALGLLKDEIPHNVVTVGGDGWDFEQIKNLVEQHGVQDRVHFLGYVSDEQLRALYRRASVYVHASLFEGFGLTVLEAMASGCPVVTSDISSLPEVAGDAAVLVDPHSSASIAAGVKAICVDKAVSEEYKNKGIKRARTFTWQKCAEKLVSVYQEVLSISNKSGR